jgi:hypothetical protein
MSLLSFRSDKGGRGHARMTTTQGSRLPAPENPVYGEQA